MVASSDAFVKVDSISDSTSSSSTTHVANSAAVKAINDALVTHQNAAHPHAQYLTPAEADERYYTKEQSNLHFAGDPNPTAGTLVKRTANGAIQARRLDALESSSGGGSSSGDTSHPDPTPEPPAPPLCKN